MLVRMVAVAMALASLGRASAQTVVRAFCGNNGKAHVLYAGKSEKIIPPEGEQVGCGDLAIADDRRSVGWAVQVENCCTSYPIAVELVVLRDGKKTVISSDQTIYQWRFVDHAEKVAMLSGPVHGGASQADLYDSRPGKKLKTWNGSGDAPKWAEGWKDEFTSEQK